MKRYGGLSGSSDEDPYSLTPSGSSGSSGKGGAKDGGSGSGKDSGNGSGTGQSPPRLPQKEKDYYVPQNWSKVGKKSNWTTSNNIGIVKSCCTSFIQFSSFQSGNRHYGHPQDYSDDMDETHGGRRTLKKENGERNGGEGVRGRNASSGTGSTELI